MDCKILRSVGEGVRGFGPAAPLDAPRIEVDKAPLGLREFPREVNKVR